MEDKVLATIYVGDVSHENLCFRVLASKNLETYSNEITLKWGDSAVGRDAVLGKVYAAMKKHFGAEPRDITINYKTWRDE